MPEHHAKPEYEVAYQDLISLIAKHKDKVTKEELLAISANVVGKIIAMLDQRTMTPEQALTIVDMNIQRGNQQALAQICGQPVVGHA